VGLIDIIDQLDLSDEAKAQIRREHEQEMAQERAERQRLEREQRRSTVETEITALADAGFKEAKGLLAFTRRVFLSDDQEPGLVLLSDHELSLQGEQASGSTQREEISTADVLRKFISMLPRTDQGAIALSEQALLTDDAGPPASGEDPSKEEKTAGARERLGNLTGQSVARTRRRYAGRSSSLTVAGGDS
jgi:hypothetical protein